MAVHEVVQMAIPQEVYKFPYCSLTSSSTMAKSHHVNLSRNLCKYQTRNRRTDNIPG